MESAPQLSEADALRLWHAARDGDKTALKELCELAEVRARDFLRGQVDVPDLEDVVQRVLLDLVRKSEQADVFVAKFHGFLKWRVRGALKEHVRLKQRARQTTSDALDAAAVASGPSPWRLAHAGELSRAYADCLTGLESMDADLLRSRFLDDQAPRVIAERVGRDANWVRVRIHRATRKLRSCLEGKGFQP
ncbi:MAG TPA: sigma-70 family RNA polymerase sigma factor [Planctomycetota bacterium]